MELPVPVNAIVVTPTVESSVIVNSLVAPEVWKTSLIRTIAVSVTIPEILEKRNLP